MWKCQQCSCIHDNYPKLHANQVKVWNWNHLTNLLVQFFVVPILQNQLNKNAPVMVQMGQLIYYFLAVKPILVYKFWCKLLFFIGSNQTMLEVETGLRLNTPPMTAMALKYATKQLVSYQHFYACHSPLCFKKVYFGSGVKHSHSQSLKYDRIKKCIPNQHFDDIQKTYCMVSLSYDGGNF